VALMVSAMGVLTLGCSVGPAASKSTTGDIKHQFARPDLPARAGALDDVVFAFPRREIRSWRRTQTRGPPDFLERTHGKAKHRSC